MQKNSTGEDTAQCTPRNFSLFNGNQSVSSWSKNSNSNYHYFIARKSCYNSERFDSFYVSCEFAIRTVSTETGRLSLSFSLSKECKVKKKTKILTSYECPSFMPPMF